MRFIIITLALLFSNASLAWTQQPPLPIEQCQKQAPYGYPQTDKRGIPICRVGYVTLNDTDAKLPIWTSYVLHPEYALGCVPRSNSFAADASLPKGMRAEVADYARSGYDIGHIAPNADMSRFDQTELESFLLTNMAPQLPGLNRGIWKLLETNVRGWTVQRGHPYVVYAGPLYGRGDKTIGLNKVVVPHGFYKIVIDMTTHETAGFMFPHIGNQGNDLTKVRAPISAIEQEARVAFSFPQDTIELPLNYIWPVNYKALHDAKTSSCH